MNECILFGAGKALKRVFNVLDRLENAPKVIEIWDTRAGAYTEGIMFKNKKWNVNFPHKLAENCVIIITSDYYEEEMSAELKNIYEIDPVCIKNWRYCLNDIKNEIIRKYENTYDKELKSCVNYLRFHDLHTFNIGIEEKYRGRHNGYVVEKDTENGLLYSYWKGNKIYFKRGMDEPSVRSYLNNISCEQDSRSAHYYLQDEVKNRIYDVIVDAGAAEGFFALERVEASQWIFLIESDPQWVEALQYTFKPWKSKIRIINKQLGNTDNESSITLDEIILPVQDSSRSILIKMDIEGAEIDSLSGNKCLVNDSNMTLLVCTYHNSEDADIISRLLLNCFFTVRFSNGYMYFLTDTGSINAELRHGLVVATKSFE